MKKGHPKGLYALFFTEMWERLAFYLMVGILFLYAKDTERGGLALSVGTAAEVMGTYLAFVYFTPFVGGMIADRFLGFRRAVAIGGVLMAAGFFMLGIRSFPTFYGGLALLCLGNGLFKPNISAMVGNLYEPGDPRRDAGFNIFYMGINIGAAVSALFSAPIRNTYGFNAAFIVAGVGLLVGVAILMFNYKALAAADKRSEPDPDEMSFKQIMLTILLPATAVGIAGYFIGAQIEFVQNTVGPITFGFILGMMPVLGYFAVIVKRAKPDEKPGLKALIPVFICGGTFFMVLHLSAGLMTSYTEENTNRPGAWIPDVPIIEDYKQKAMPSYFDNAGADVPRPDERTLLVVEENSEAMFGARRLSDGVYKGVLSKYPDVKAVAVDGEGYDKAWAQVACKVFEDSQVEVKSDTDAHGRKTISVQVPETAKPMQETVFTRTIDGKAIPLLLVSGATFKAVYEKAGQERIPLGEYLDLYNAEIVTGFFNPLFVVLLTPVIVAFFGFMTRRGKEVSTARKVLIGMLLTTVSLGIMALAAHMGGDGDDKTTVMWLATYYLVITAGELCLSPMGLSLVTKLAPKRLVGLMMGCWFLSTAIGNKLSGFISGLHPTTAIFVVLGAVTLLVAIVIMVLLPWLDRTIKRYGA